MTILFFSDIFIVVFGPSGQVMGGLFAKKKSKKEPVNKPVKTVHFEPKPTKWKRCGCVWKFFFNVLLIMAERNKERYDENNHIGFSKYTPADFRRFMKTKEELEFEGLRSGAHDLFLVFKPCFLNCHSFSVRSNDELMHDPSFLFLVFHTLCENRGHEVPEVMTSHHFYKPLKRFSMDERGTASSIVRDFIDQYFDIIDG